MKPEKVYIDTMFLIRWFLYILEKRKIPRIIKFLNEQKKIQKHISLISIAEAFKVLKHGNDYKKYNLQDDQIEGMLSSLQEYISLKVILRDEIEGIRLKGIVVSTDIIDFVKKHGEIRDCIHVDVAKSHNLYFLTDDRKIGRLKGLYKNIMTEKKFIKQFKNQVFG